MPIYEYRCNSCRAVTNVFVRTVSSPVNPVCSRCQGTDMVRLVSRPYVMKSAADRLDEYDVQRSLGRLEDPSDPRAVARWAREVGGELGDELGDELREMAEQVESEQDLYDPYDPAADAFARGGSPEDDLGGHAGLLEDPADA